MGAIEPFKGRSYTLMTCSNNFIFNLNYIHKYLPKIML